MIKELKEQFVYTKNSANKNKNAEIKKVAVQHIKVTVGLAASVLLLAVFCTAELTWDIRRLNFNHVESYITTGMTLGEHIDTDTVLESGACKGIKTTEHIAFVYNNIMDDLDIIKANISEQGSVLVQNLLPYCYLHLDKNYGTFSTWYNSNENYRLLEYYRLYPERIPEYIYLPKYNPYFYTAEFENALTGRLSWIETTFDCIVSNRKAGYIIKVNSVKTEKST